MFWEIIACKSTPSRNQSKHLAKREERKNKSVELEAMLGSLASKIKDDMGQCTTNKEMDQYGEYL